ncbi:MAG: B12-binding domain-containing radical SAM protein [Thermotogaceae bacterium]|nr:B12-binding domain-containing radical SAM protein [Thermotogaceae bacterium]
MKALLVNPVIHDFAAYDFWLKPLGLLYVGAFLSHIGFEVHLIDLLNRHEPDIEKFVKVPKDKYYGTGKFPAEEIEKPDVLSNIPRRFKRYGAPPEYLEYKIKEIGKVDVVFVTSVMTYWYHGVWETIKFIKTLTDAPVILGGIYTNILPNHAVRSPADFVFSSNHLELLPKFLKDKLSIETNDPPIEWFEDLDPAYFLYKKVGYLVFTTSIGCPFKCTYCITPIMWEKHRRRSEEKIIDAIEKYLDMFHVEDIAFFDDAFLMSKGRAKKLLSLLIERKLNKRVRFHLPNGIHARFVDEEVACLLYEANFKTIKLGYETSGELQERTGGKVFDSDLEKAVEFLKEAGFTHKEVAAYVLINMPEQRLEDIINALYFVNSLKIKINLNEYTPIPGTPDWHELTKKGTFQKDIDPLLLNNTILPFWWKYGMSKSEVEYAKKLTRELNNKLNNNYSL